MVKILVADDHAIVREGLKQIIADTFDMTVTDEASNGQEVLDKVSKNDYDVLVLDISMPGWSGLDILKKVKTRRRRTRPASGTSLFECRFSRATIPANPAILSFPRSKLK